MFYIIFKSQRFHLKSFNFVSEHVRLLERKIFKTSLYMLTFVKLVKHMMGLVMLLYHRNKSVIYVFVLTQPPHI